MSNTRLWQKNSKISIIAWMGTLSHCIFCKNFYFSSLFIKKMGFYHSWHNNPWYNHLRYGFGSCSWWLPNSIANLFIYRDTMHWLPAPRARKIHSVGCRLCSKRYKSSTNRREFLHHAIESKGSSNSTTGCHRIGDSELHREYWWIATSVDVTGKIRQRLGEWNYESSTVNPREVAVRFSRSR